MNVTRVAPIGIAVALALASCGGDEPGLSDVDGRQPPVPIQVTAGGDGGGRMASAELSDDAIAPSIEPMPWFVGFEYEVGPGLPALPTADTGYQFLGTQTIDAATVARLADALGVPGEPIRGSGRTEDGVAWRVGPDDGTAPSLVVIDDAQLGWYYSSAWAIDVRADVACVTADGGTGESPVDPVAPPPGDVDVAEICPDPEPPAGVPNGADAEAAARSILAAMGVDLARFEFETFADPWYASVTAWQLLDGVRSPMSWSFGYGGGAELQWAGGYLAEPIATGPYPLIDLETALDRLREQGSMWGGLARAGGDLAVDAVASPEIDPVASDDAGAEGSGDGHAGGSPETTTAPEPPEVTVPEETVPEVTVPEVTVPEVTVPVETVPEVTVPEVTVPVETVPVVTVPEVTVPDETVPEPVAEVAVLVDVRADLWWAWDADGSIWLLPAYTFVDTEGRTHTVPAVTDEFLIVVEPQPMPEPMPAEPVDPVLVDPGATEPGVADPSDPVEQGGGSSGGDAGEPVPVDKLELIVGLSTAEATDTLASMGLTMRVVRQDGVDLPATMDYVPTRANVAVDGDVVTEVLSVG